MKSAIRFSRASRSTRQRVERIFQRGKRAMRRQFVAAQRKLLREDERGMSHE